MKFFLNHSITLILTVCYCINSYAVTDSLPSCIKNLTSGELSTYSEYEYKGKRLFSYTTVPKNVTPKYYDSLSTIRYYDSSCQLFCTWMIGGIMGSKMIPNTIEKQKIITLRVIKFDSISKTKPIGANSLPDTIAKIALIKNSNWIEETVYNGKLIYRFQDPLAKPSKITFVRPYFGEQGNIVSPVTQTGRAFWWHYSNGKFSKTQFRPGYR